MSLRCSQDSALPVPLHWVWWSMVTLDMPPVVALHAHGQPFLVHSNQWRMCQVGFHQGRCQDSAHFLGWGSGPLTVPGSGTLSWMFCMLISLGLERAEVLRAVVPFSVGGRAQIPPDQAQFRHRNVPHVIEALASHFLGFSSSDPRAVALTSRESW